MATCKKCNNEFKRTVYIEGKRKYLQKRQYCLECSPFGSKNTRQLHVIGLAKYETYPTRHLTCTVCNREYDYHHADPKGHTKTKCNSCLVNQRRFDIKRKAVEYKGGNCERCGYNKCLRALSFHHKDPSQKDFSVSGKHCRAWERIRVELDKCMMVCANCHMEIHEKLEK
jgi:hypothetical protein